MAIIVGKPVAPSDESYTIRKEANESHEGPQQNPPAHDTLREALPSTLASRQSHDMNTGGLATISKVRTEAPRNGLSTELIKTLKQKPEIEIVEHSSTPPKKALFSAGDMVEFEAGEGIIGKCGGLGMILMKHPLEKITDAAENPSGGDETV